MQTNDKYLIYSRVAQNRLFKTRHALLTLLLMMTAASCSESDYPIGGIYLLETNILQYPDLRVVSPYAFT